MIQDRPPTAAAHRLSAPGGGEREASVRRVGLDVAKYLAELGSGRRLITPRDAPAMRGVALIVH
ncbi:hypothetical protein RPIT_11375 [Tessaracoccus flavus]|uniref:Uncharacterized protein n=1 Tax=Tessaracoccus flavus TaxID=1610493 RepID=A0A1Q2CGS5_9ACTN|nr:hypothetical protein RPIT_11375 [Tessaracoccus flavus]